MITHEFKSSKQNGAIGESVFESLAVNVFGRDAVQNVTDVKEWQEKGVDFIVNDITYDVKFDMKAPKTGNVAFETIAKSKDNVIEKLGWVYTTEANCIVYLTHETSSWKFYFFTKEEVVKLVEEHGNNNKPVKNKTYMSEVVLVPLTSLGYKKTLQIPLMSSPTEDNAMFFKNSVQSRLAEQKHLEI